MSWLRAAWRPVVAGLVVAALALAIGLRGWTPVVLGVLVLAVVVLVRRVDVTDEPAFDRPRPRREHGVRGDIQELAWTMIGRDRRVGEPPMRRLRAAANHRLARHGVRSDDEIAVRALLGDRAARTLARTSPPLPTLADVRHALDVLERLGPDRHPVTEPGPIDSDPRRSTP